MTRVSVFDMLWEGIMERGNRMPTIKDIAKAAGVSHATVSNVLNRKGNVSAEKIKLVQDTARAMGYRIHEAASALRSGKARVLGVILPDVQSQAHGDLLRGLNQAASDRGFSVLLRLTDNVPEQERRAIQDLLSARAACVAAVSSFPDPREKYAELAQAGIRVQFALRSGPDEADYMGFDLEAAARMLATQALGDGAERVGVMTNLPAYPAERALQEALTRVLGKRLWRAVHGIVSQYDKQALDLLEGEGPDVVIATCGEMAEAVLRVCAAMRRTPPRLYALAARRVFLSPAYGTCALDYRALGRCVGEQLLSEAPPSRVVLPPEAPAPQTPAVLGRTALRMLSIDNPYTDALRKLAPLLQKQTGIELAITTLPTALVTKALADPERVRGFDLMRMDLALMDCYAGALFEPLDQGYGVLPTLTAEYAMADGQVRSLPFDPSCQLLLYRKDLFENPRYQRAYLETFHRPLDLPAQYGQYAQVAAFFDGFVEETGARGALVGRQNSECIAQIIALSEDGTWPSLTEEAFCAEIETRRRLEAASGIADSGNWNDTVDRFARGESVMMLAHSNYAERLSHDPLLRTAGRVGYTAAFGQHPLLGGGVIGIGRHASDKSAAKAFLAWLYGERTARLMALLGGSSPCPGPYREDEVLDLYPWLSSVYEGFAKGIRRGIFSNAKRPFHQLRAEERIANAFAAAVSGEVSPKQAHASVVTVVQSLQGKTKGK